MKIQILHDCRWARSDPALPILCFKKGETLEFEEIFAKRIIQVGDAVSSEKLKKQIDADKLIKEKMEIYTKDKMMPKPLNKMAPQSSNKYFKSTKKRGKK